MPSPCTARYRLGFTLVELMIVITILGILAALVVPRYTVAREQAQVSAIQTNLTAMRTAVTQHQAKFGEYPTLDASFFVGQVMPDHPWDAQNHSPIDHDDDATSDMLDPDNKLITDAPGPYWYNLSNGQIKSRVPDRGSSAANLELYNLVNGTSLTEW